MVIPSAGAPTINYDELHRKLQSASSQFQLFHKVANLPFEYKLEMALLFLGLISLYVADPEEGVVKLAAVSDTEHYRISVQNYKFDPASFKVPLTDHDNSIVKAIKQAKAQSTTDWATLSRANVHPKYSRDNQASSGIAHNTVYPLDVPGGGAMLFAYYQYQEDMGQPQEEFMGKYSALVSAVLKRRLHELA
ncbi:MAG TPA: hypothetical protein VN778_04280 [Verrucomicrobiae bacterium]|nr:hypothetical protein [Verrucomicrobiae bacterium]